MTQLSATTILIHHTGKSDTSKKSRGGSAFEGGMDIAWLVESNIVNCNINSMTLSPWKSRLGLTQTYNFKMIDGRPVLDEENVFENSFVTFISNHEGLTKDALEKAAVKSPQGFSRKFVREMLIKLMVGGKVKKVGKKMYLAETEVKEDAQTSGESDTNTTDGSGLFSNEGSGEGRLDGQPAEVGNDQGEQEAEA
jgi:hypothetical protein